MRVFGICGKSNAGRSELVAELVARFRFEGLRVAIVKRAPVSFDMDTPGTDSRRQRESGCDQMLIASDRRLALLEEYPSDSATPDVRALIDRLKPTDVVLLINFRDEAIPRIEVEDDGERSTGTERNAECVLARVGRTAGACCTFGLEDCDSIARFVLRHAATWPGNPGERSPYAPLRA